ncbi:hypothetical protein BDN71DRAFT_1452280 [Pleurotus eryngii]|uniref:Uncharacterized protein n=1 Tax=Pleurotus eryngii TaxID=5323 RepID=A0A9P6D433_PLEER|nr:hypothetical protein BDN71DRAFT_1452280 [Pleurotus eryngii]
MSWDGGCHWRGGRRRISLPSKSILLLVLSQRFVNSVSRGTVVIFVEHLAENVATSLGVNLTHLALNSSPVHAAGHTKCQSWEVDVERWGVSCASAVVRKRDRVTRVSITMLPTTTDNSVNVTNLFYRSAKHRIRAEERVPAGDPHVTTSLQFCLISPRIQVPPQALRKIST